MELLKNLFEGYPDLWGGGVAHSVLILSLVIAFGIMLAKIKVAGVSLGITWILFVGIVFGHFDMTLNEHLLHFMKEFGLILFVYSIGLQVGPGFFSAFKKGGLTLNLLAMLVVFLGVVITIILHFVTGTPITTMVGILSGAVTNTPGLGAAQQANSDLNGIDAPEIALGYAVAYPLGVVGIILSLIALKYILRINTKTEEAEAERGLGHIQELTVRPISFEIRNEAIDGKKIKDIRPLMNRDFVISRVRYHDGQETELANSDTVLHLNDKILVISTPKDIEAISVFFGKQIDMQWEQLDKKLISRRILITKPELNGKMLSQLKIRNNFGASITRVNRSGVDLVAAPQLQLQMGDRVTIVGSELAVSHAEKVLGNSMKRLDHPNPIPIFLGIALGCILGSTPFVFPGIPQPVKLGLAGGPLIVSILISRFGPQYKMITYTTMSANLMLREIGISLFLACVGLGAGKGFVETVIYDGGYVWVGYGVIITIVPLLIAGLVGRYVFKLNYYTLIGVLGGSTTNPPALAYSNDLTSCDAPAVGYATVYPLTMFLRVLTAQMLILALA
ncbi:putative transporter [Bacteroides cellulosilyticus]|uniref:putative transporter n=1 Tax=Bacteroides cellulosilyticus TaxID=246787 RepID=UPI001C37873C|nr:putative transporter [Bacteroides cellulosilyticus]MBV3639513.1 putative transporter [Bacteroides cellulosilyticus]MBV3665543.1 putative transporter [Bacteroides cellulosilyticus]MBV3687611.1 putative transporter [Bacteroides cellulosilyticus]MBV3696312.1 putative transporter [Bacteroides cellulosilyticus]MBV3709878.1 putative transporter [Bacteroides cellulosilyticus]